MRGAGQSLTGKYKFCPALFGGYGIMGKIVIDVKNCRGCFLCRKACPVHAIEISDRHAHVGEACKECGRCLKSCPFGAIRKDRQ